jgi:hypothetical protein
VLLLRIRRSIPRRKPYDVPATASPSLGAAGRLPLVLDGPNRETRTIREFRAVEVPPKRKPRLSGVSGIQGRQDSNLQPPVLETGALPIAPRPWAAARIVSAPSPGAVVSGRAARGAVLRHHRRIRRDRRVERRGFAVADCPRRGGSGRLDGICCLVRTEEKPLLGRILHSWRARTLTHSGSSSGSRAIRASATG